jgi:hypothetical protein
MAAKKSTRRRSRPAQSSPRLPEGIADRIESERRRLNKAIAVLIGAELSRDYYPDLELITDAISVARDLVTQAVDALDLVELRRS